jgi:hypothetical protein
VWQGYAGDIVIDAGTLAGFAVACIPPLTPWIRAHHSDIPTGPKIFMRYPGRDNHHVAAVHCHDNTLFAAKLHGGVATKHA